MREVTTTSQKKIDEWIGKLKDGTDPQKLTELLEDIPAIWAKDRFTFVFKTELFEAFSGKCVFCERIITDDRSRRILHYRPNPFDRRSNNYTYIWLNWQWPNIYPACEQCYVNYPKYWDTNHYTGNQADPKKDPFDVLFSVEKLSKQEVPLIIDPCFDNPARHIIFQESGDKVSIEGKTRRGKITIKTLSKSLNDDKLCKERMVELKEFKELYERTLAIPDEVKNSDLLAECASDLLAECASDQQFAGMKRQFLHSWLKPRKQSPNWQSDLREQLEIWRDENVVPPLAFPKPLEGNPGITPPPPINGPDIRDPHSILDKIKIPRSEIETLLRKMYEDYTRIDIQESYIQGASGALVLRIRPFSNRQAYLDEIAKIGFSDTINKEWEAYKAHILNTLPDIASIKGEPSSVLVETVERGGIRYQFAGDGVFKITSLREYLKSSSVTDGYIQKVLKDLLFEKIGDKLWKNSVLYYDYWFRKYDNVLPVNLELVEIDGETNLREAQLTQITPENGYHNRRNFKPGDLVQLSNFVITEIDPDGSKVTLDQKKVDGDNDFRLRITVKESSSRYKVGDPANFTGRIDRTRTLILQDHAKSALGQEYDPAKGKIRLPDQTEVRDPIFSLDDMVEKQIDVKVSSIHGDMNLDNIIVRHHERSLEPTNIHLIDFARAHKDHALQDLIHLEVNVWLHLYSTGLDVSDKLSDLPATFRSLQPGEPGENMGQTNHQNYLILTLIRGAAKKYLANENWDEYFLGLSISLLGCLKYKSLSEAPNNPLPKKVAIYLAAMALDTCTFSSSWRKQ